MKTPLPLKVLHQYGIDNNLPHITQDVDELWDNRQRGNYSVMWDLAVSAPHRFASQTETRFLVILDEFQNIASFIYPDKDFKADPIDSMAGSFHSLSESKVAPMLVTGSYVRWLINIMDKYLEAGRLSRIFMTPYLTEEDGLAAVYKYAEVYREPITNESAILINKLCFSDPFFISCVVQSNFEEKDLSTEEGAAATVDYEIINRQSEMSMTWREYIDTTLDKINDRYAKQILLHLSKHNEREWTPRELKQAMTIDLSEEEIHRELLTLSKSDLIERGNADIDFRGLKDGTLNLVLRSRFEKEIVNHQPNFKVEFSEEIKVLKKDKKKLQGMLNHLSGLIAETQLAVSMRSKKRFKISDYFTDVTDENIVNLVDVRNRVLLQRDDGRKMEIDLLAESKDSRLIVVEVKKTKTKTGVQIIEDFLEKTELVKERNPDKIVLPMVLSLGGFTEEAVKLCREKGIGMTEEIKIW